MGTRLNFWGQCSHTPNPEETEFAVAVWSGRELDQRHHSSEANKHGESYYHVGCGDQVNFWGQG